MAIRSTNAHPSSFAPARSRSVRAAAGHPIVARAIDLIGAVLALLITLPIMVVAAIAVGVTSKGPVLFRQERVGRSGDRFSMLKFRTMRSGADAAPHRRYVASLIRGQAQEQGDAGLYKLVDDERVTSVGRALRRLSIDELPQLLNVVIGDMRLVGPRPALSFEVDLYEDWQLRRLSVKPGMTGLWQVSGRSRLTYQDMVRLDLSYIDSWSPLQDIRILLRTVPAIMRREAS
jgi:lipopolysaccharide/colanic/teichoic acid biosynthesis glycosyltransferase